jgi:hypothetical protein
MLNALKKYWPVLAGGVIVATVLGMLYVFSIGPNGVSSFTDAAGAQPSPVPVAAFQVDGVYKNDANGVVTQATIEHDTIVITMEREGTTMTYWRGSFDSNAKVGATIASLKDDSQALLVVDDVKQITVGDGTLSYRMTMLGVSKEMNLTHV